ncbi:hypothetical protein ACFWIB_34560 [Streptomyces sp. NPDC127051]|uniref:hypothetical protein n=1 Tax=Streptomyces sp. NPDC127051 TaxID=3347119 RepID=UPI003663A2DF
MFLSWSGPRSKAVAEFLGDWLPDVIQAVDPWISSRNIPQGGRPLPAIADELSGANFGIACITAENVDAPWINFEAGALSKELGGSHVVPFLLGIEKAQVAGPLSQFQMTVGTEKEEVRKLILDINDRLGESAIAGDRLERSFERNWDALRMKVEGIISGGAPEGTASPKRPVEDVLDEILILMRRQDRRLSELEELRSPNTSTPTQLPPSASPVSSAHRLAMITVRKAVSSANKLSARTNGDTITVTIRDQNPFEVDMEKLQAATDKLSTELEKTIVVNADEHQICISHFPF